MATLHQAGLSTQFFLQHLLTLYLCVSLLILTLSLTFSLLCLLWWSVTSDLWGYYCNCFGSPQTAHIRWQTVEKCFVCLTIPLTSLSSVFVPFFRLPISLNITILKIGQLISLQWSLSIQVKGRGTSLSFKSKARSRLSLMKKPCQKSR